jgi:ferredoxin
MPQITVDGKTFSVEQGKRLVLALEENGVQIGHRCGGNARCTTCRVVFQSGEPEVFTAAEFDKLKERGLFGEARLSCQIVCTHDMELAPVMTVENQPAWNGDTGPTPDPVVRPEAAWFNRNELQKQAEG